MWQTDEDDDADGGSVFGKTHAHVAMKKWLPFLGRGEEDGYQHGTDGANNGVEEGCKGEVVMGALQFLDGFMEVDDDVEEREDFGRKVGYVAHGPIMGVGEGKKEVHPAGVDEGPGHEREKGDLGYSSTKSFSR